MTAAVCKACAHPMATAEHLAGPFCDNAECARRGAVILPPLNLTMRHNSVQPSMNDVKPMRIWRHATMWEVTEGEVTDHPDGWLNRKVIWEPLETNAPQDAEPYCCYLNTVIFYENRHSGSAVKEITRCTHYELTSISPHLLFVDNVWWEVGLGRVVWRNGQWYFMHVLDRNSREARRAQLGHLAVLDGERQIEKLYRREE